MYKSFTVRMRRAAQGGMVDSVTESLPMLIARRMAELGVKNLSELHRRLPADDGRVTYETVRNLANGKQRTVREERVLHALADMLDVNVNTVRAALQMEPDYGEWVLPERAQGLDPQERQVVVSVVDALLRAKRTGGQQDDWQSEDEKSPDEVMDFATARQNKIIQGAQEASMAADEGDDPEGE